MIRRVRIVLRLVALAGLWAAMPRSPDAAARPALLGDKSQTRPEQVVAKARQGGCGLVMIGDSITDWWPGRGQATWKPPEVCKRTADANALIARLADGKDVSDQDTGLNSSRSSAPERQPGRTSSLR